MASLLDPLKRAGLEPRHLTKLLPISRVTASRWLNQGVEPHPFIKSQVDRIVQAVTKALEAGHLPFPANLAKQDQLKYLTKVLGKHTESN